MTQPPQPPYGQPQPGAQYPGQYPPVQPPKKKKWPWILLAIFVVIIAAFAGCAALVGGAVNSVNEESTKEVTVTYEVTGDAQGALVTYTSGDANMAQENGITLPWSKDVTVTGIIKVATVTATNGFEDEGTIGCKIIVDGSVVTENTSSGIGASATCTQADIAGN